MINDIVEKMLDDMEPKPKSLLWTSTHKEKTVHRRLEAKVILGIYLLEVFNALGQRFHRDGEGTQRLRKRCAGEWEFGGEIVTSVVE